MSLVDVFINMFFSILNGMIGFLPNATSPVLPEPFKDGISWVVTSASQWNGVFPVTAAFQVVLFILSFELIFYGFKLIVFVYDKIRGSG